MRKLTFVLPLLLLLAGCQPAGDTAPEPIRQIAQYAIADFLDRQTRRIDALVARTRSAIELLREYRISLISAAVTGQIDVREFAPSP